MTGARAAIAAATVAVALSGAASAQPRSGTDPLRIGWDARDPYQFLDRSGAQEFLTGLDVEIVRSVGTLAGLRVSFESAGWASSLEGVKTGARDAALGVFRTPEREQYAYFSEPYRQEQDLLFLPATTAAQLSATTLPALLEQMRDLQLRLGVVEGYYYGPEVAAFAATPATAALVIRSASDGENVERLADGSIDAFLADRLVGLELANVARGLQVRPHPVLVYSAPVHVMFSRLTTAPATVDAFNRGLAALQDSGDYDRIVRRFTGPILISSATGSRWFFVLDVIGTIAFAISGVIIARKESYSLFGALVLAALPAVGGGVVRDLLIGRRPIGVLQAPLYLLLVLGTVAVGYFIYLTLDRTRGRFLFMFDLSNWVVSMSRVVLPRNVFEVFDAVGLAAFTVTGVAIASSAGAEPLLVWGPLCAALTGAGGGILRDVIRADAHNPTLKTALYAEIALAWGFLMSLFLQFQGLSDDPGNVRLAVLGTVLGVLATRTAVIAAKVRSPRF